MDNLETTDIVLAAYLKLKGFKMTNIVRHGNKGTFVFDKVPENVINEYDIGQALIEPRALNAEIKALTTSVRR
jgi:hypothetical protein